MNKKEKEEMLACFSLAAKILCNLEVNSYLIEIGVKPSELERFKKTLVQIYIKHCEHANKQFDEQFK